MDVSIGPCEDLLVPCYEFSVILPDLYTSALPSPKNFLFLRSLGLRSMCYLGDDQYPTPNAEFCGLSGIALHKFPLPENFEPFRGPSPELLSAVLRVVLNADNMPMLIHCSEGRHRVGLIRGCLRKIQNWLLASIYAEYALYNHGKLRLAAMQFLDIYRPIISVDWATIPSWMFGGKPPQTVERFYVQVSENVSQGHTGGELQLRDKNLVSPAAHTERDTMGSFYACHVAPEGGGGGYLLVDYAETHSTAVLDFLETAIMRGVRPIAGVENVRAILVHHPGPIEIPSGSAATASIMTALQINSTEEKNA